MLTLRLLESNKKSVHINTQVQTAVEIAFSQELGRLFDFLNGNFRA